ncbi:hypothetical protein [Parvibaculum sp.]
MRCVWNRLCRLLAGRRLAAAIERNNDAADRLDAALREVLRR